MNTDTSRGLTLAASPSKEDVAAIIDNVRAVSDQFKGVAGKLEAALDNLSGFLSNGDGKSTLSEISAAATSFRSLAEKLDKSIGNSADGMARFATDGLSQFEQLMRDARQMVKTMERVLDNIDRNPQGLLFGSKQVREYKAN
jgi:phospholipid/cholesterol/gamma-HCH transport system substrate-binding protein